MLQRGGLFSKDQDRGTLLAGCREKKQNELVDVRKGRHVCFVKYERLSARNRDEEALMEGFRTFFNQNGGSASLKQRGNGGKTRQHAFRGPGRKAQTERKQEEGARGLIIQQRNARERLIDRRLATAKRAHRREEWYCLKVHVRKKNIRRGRGPEHSKFQLNLDVTRPRSCTDKNARRAKGVSRSSNYTNGRRTLQRKSVDSPVGKSTGGKNQKKGILIFRIKKGGKAFVTETRGGLLRLKRGEDILIRTSRGKRLKKKADGGTN